MNTTKAILRPITSADQSFLAEVLYLAFFLPAGEPPFPRSILERSDILKYHKNWGKAGDYGFIAMLGEQAVGAIWCRLHTPQDPGYGFVREGIPELNLALVPSARGQGIGTQLMLRLEEELIAQQVPGMSLSVDHRNKAAVKLYQKLAYQTVAEEDTAITMIKMF